MTSQVWASIYSQDTDDGDETEEEELAGEGQPREDWLLGCETQVSE